MWIGPSSVRRSTRVWIGSFLILISITAFLVIHRWLYSRTFVLVDMPISLARGRIKAGPFTINLKNYYEVHIETGWGSYNDPNCSSYGLDYSLLFRWFVGLNMDDPIWDVTVFTKNRQRLPLHAHHDRVRDHGVWSG